jgi:hypothetical protein
MGISASRLHQLVKSLWHDPRQNAVESKISAAGKLLLHWLRLLVVSQYATISKRDLSPAISERAANDNTQDIASPLQTLSAFRTIESLLESAADALSEAKDLAHRTGHAGRYANSIGQQIGVLDDEILPEIRAAVTLLQAEVRP